MVKACMQGSRVYQVGQSQLLDTAKALEPGVFDQVKNKRGRNVDESVYRVIDDLTLVVGCGLQG